MTNSPSLQAEQKNIINLIVQKVLNFFNLSNQRDNVDEFVKEQYDVGVEKSSIQFNVDFVRDDEELRFLQGFVNDNLQDTADQIGDDLRKELSVGIMNKESVSQLKKRIQGTFKDKKIANRLKTVLRTEGLRARNQGALEGAEQSGLKLRKWVDIVNDSRTSNICKAENRKYGGKEKSIPLNKEFIVKAENKTVRGQNPPFHPNCRSVVRFVEADEV